MRTLCKHFMLAGCELDHTTCVQATCPDYKPLETCEEEQQKKQCIIKVGDRVKVVDEEHEKYCAEGVVKLVLEDYVGVQFGGWEYYAFHKNDLELVKSYNPEQITHKETDDGDSDGWSMKDGYAYYTKCNFWEDHKKTPESVLQSCIDLYKEKNKEYQNTEDQFENFTKGSELNQCSREQVLWGYVTKQIVSLASIIKTGKNRDKISEKTRDIIVYMAILEAMQ